MIVYLNGLRNLRIWIAPLFALGALGGCSADISVPSNAEIEGCYASDGLQMKLKDYGVIWKGQKIASFYQGNDASGSFIVFKPALVIVNDSTGQSMSIDRQFPKGYTTTIMERSRVTILMPTKPLGQTKLVKRDCT